MGNESSSLQNAGTCKACKDYGNRETDTVKVDFDKIRDPATGKENSGPGPVNIPQMSKETATQKQLRVEEEKEKRLTEEALEEHRRRQEEEEAKQRQEVEAKRQEILRLRKEEEAQERQRQEAFLRQQQEEEQRRQAALEEKRRQQEEAERLELARIAEERRQQRAKEERLERQRQFQLEQEQERQRQLQKLAQERNAKLQGMLEKAGFSNIDEKKVKKSMLSSSFSYPLHAAVEAKDLEFVELLLGAGADPLVENSKKLTPLQLAEKKNDKQGSHAKVIAALRRSPTVAAAGA